MKKVIIQEIQLTNFKGINYLKLNFGERTTISGKNGSGKTTIFDAFTWLLFGKDSQDRKAFDIKTIGKDGKVIPKIPHDVSAILVVDGEKVCLTRRYTEKWTKKRGSAVEEFTGNEEERLYNDVPMSVKEWNEKIAAICSEQVFKFITNPLYFTSQKEDVQRAMLFRMAGDISDSEIAAGNKDFESLLSKLTGKSMEEYKREIQAKKRRIKTEIDAIPERIDERKRDIDSINEIDFVACEKELSDKRKAQDDIERQIVDARMAQTTLYDKREALNKELSDVQQKLMKRKNDIKSSVYADYLDKLAKKNKLERELADCNERVDNINRQISERSSNIDTLNKRRELLIEQWRSINAREITFDPETFKCPTCGRALEIDDIENKQKELTEKFNAGKASEIAENVKNGKQVKTDIEYNNARISDLRVQLDEIKSRIVEINNSSDYTCELAEPISDGAIENDAEVKLLYAKIDELKSRTFDEKVQDVSDLIDNNKMLQESIEELNNMLSKKEVVKRNKDRIAELERQLRNQSDELAKLEGEEFTISAFAKARVESIESKINALFSFVRFKMFDTQINGGEVETCEAIADGKPFSTQNNAMRYNMGIDIINAICKFEGVSAPIFIDNAESINNITQTDSQVIRLVVSFDEQLIIS